MSEFSKSVPYLLLYHSTVPKLTLKLPLNRQNKQALYSQLALVMPAAFPPSLQKPGATGSFGFSVLNGWCQKGASQLRFAMDFGWDLWYGTPKSNHKMEVQVGKASKQHDENRVSGM